MDRLVQLAWDNLYEADVTEAFAAAILSRVKLHDELVNADVRAEFAKKVHDDHERRRIVWKTLLPQMQVERIGRSGHRVIA